MSAITSARAIQRRNPRGSSRRIPRHRYPGTGALFCAAAPTQGTDRRAASPPPNHDKDRHDHGPADGYWAAAAMVVTDGVSVFPREPPPTAHGRFAGTPFPCYSTAQNLRGMRGLTATPPARVDRVPGHRTERQASMSISNGPALTRVPACSQEPPARRRPARPDPQYDARRPVSLGPRVGLWRYDLAFTKPIGLIGDAMALTVEYRQPLWGWRSGDRPTRCVHLVHRLSERHHRLYGAEHS